MKPDRLPSPNTLARLMDRLGSQPMDIELFILKCHLITERELYWVLAHRLEIEEKYLPPLQFLQLSKLALGGAPCRATLVKVLALNDLRNEIGHELDVTQRNDRYEQFTKKTEVFWPPEDPLGDPEAFQRRVNRAFVSAPSHASARSGSISLNCR